MDALRFLQSAIVGVLVFDIGLTFFLLVTFTSISAGKRLLARSYGKTDAVGQKEVSEEELFLLFIIVLEALKEFLKPAA